MEIQSYVVGTNRQREASNYHRRFLLLEPKNPSSNVQHIVIYFFIRERVTNDDNVGYQTPNSTKYVVGFAPVSDFEDMYKILQSEKPVHFHWAADNQDKLYWFGITTAEEPPGEGPGDWSP